MTLSFTQLHPVILWERHKLKMGDIKSVIQLPHHHVVKLKTRATVFFQIFKETLLHLNTLNILLKYIIISIKIYPEKQK